jgi:hypothetical protein
MTKTTTINIDLDRPCRKCGKKGAAQNGLCLECITAFVEQGAFDHIIHRRRTPAAPDAHIDGAKQGDEQGEKNELRFIPDDVRVARRLGETVTFEQPCHNPCCWYWQFPGGGRTYYWEREAYEQIAETNGIELNEDEFGTKIGEAGACPLCGNVHTSGGHIASP